MPLATQCLECQHYKTMLECDAYPNGIPEIIYSGEHDHREHYKGDNGIRFEPMKQLLQGE